VISGAGVTSKSFDLSILLDYLPKHIDQSKKFRNWYHSGEETFVKEIHTFDKQASVNPRVKSEA
jgi:hypothetical protein